MMALSTYLSEHLYRLTSSDGHALSLPYELAMTYSASGNIVKKALTVTKDILGNSQQLTYDNRYSYTQGHQVAEINDYGMHFGDRYFEYDLNGNMIRQDIVNDDYETTQRTLCWDEENRLAGTSDNNYVTANIYDAGGQRHWKLAGQSNFMWVNGQGLVGFGSFNLRTWYQCEQMFCI